MRFEEWAESPPREWSVERFPNDPKKYAWPGRYKDYMVFATWEAWREATIQANPDGGPPIGDLP